MDLIKQFIAYLRSMNRYEKFFDKFIIQRLKALLFQNID